jgi:hypothetical protein
MQRPEEAREGAGRLGAADRSVVGWFAVNPSRDSPGLGETRRRFAGPHRIRYRQRQTRGQVGQPLLLGAQQGRGTRRARQAHGQLLPETPHAVVPATGDLTKPQSGVEEQRNSR